MGHALLRNLNFEFGWNLNGSISCKFNVILIDLLRFKICNLYISILKGSNQDQDVIMITVE